MTRRQVLTTVAAGVVFLFAGGARADAIDGSWCFRGRHLEIEGPNILTPGGRRMTGDYHRHGFVYAAPSGEKEAGSTIYMILLDEETMEFRVGSQQAQPDIWRRCASPTS